MAETTTDTVRLTIDGIPALEAQENLEVSDGELEFSFRGNCGYESDFAYEGPV